MLSRESVVALIFAGLGCTAMSVLWMSGSWRQHWDDADLLARFSFLTIVSFVFGFALVLTAKQTRTGYVLIAPFFASFFLLPWDILLVSLIFPFIALMQTFGALSNLAAVAGGFLARALLLRREQRKEKGQPRGTGLS